MTKVLTFSRTFPANHPKAGEPTFFVEKFWNSLFTQQKSWLVNINKILALNTGKEKQVEILWENIEDGFIVFDPKNTTIRAGTNWKVGDRFSPRVWSGKPYNSPQITIAPDIEIVKVWKFEIKVMYSPNIYGGSYAAALIDDKPVFGNMYFELAKNDGLDHIDLVYWLQPKGKPTAFSGQILCWNKDIEY